MDLRSVANIVGYLLGILALAMLVLAFKLFTSGGESASNRKMNSLMLQVAILAFFVGILSQAIGLMQAFSVIAQAGGVSPALTHASSSRPTDHPC